MTDRNELRRLAEAVKAARAALVGHFCTYEEGFDWCQSPLHDDMIEALDSFKTAASPDVVLGLLDEIERLRDQLRAEVDRQKAWAQQMALADVAHLSEVLGIIAEFDPAVTHGWAECVREMARSALRVKTSGTDHRAVAVRLKEALLWADDVIEGEWPQGHENVRKIHAILADPEVEKL